MLPVVFVPAIATFVVRKWITREGFADAGLRLNLRAVAVLLGGVALAVAYPGMHRRPSTALQGRETGFLFRPWHPVHGTARISSMGLSLSRAAHPLLAHQGDSRVAGVIRRRVWLARLSSVAAFSRCTCPECSRHRRDLGGLALAPDFQRVQLSRSSGDRQPAGIPCVFDLPIDHFRMAAPAIGKYLVLQPGSFRQQRDWRRTVHSAIWGRRQFPFRLASRTSRLDTVGCFERVDRVHRAAQAGG